MRALVKLEQVLPAHLRRRVNALQTRDRDARRRRRPDGRPRGADRDRRRLPRPRAPALRTTAAATAPRAGASSSRTARQPRAALVPRRLGLRPRGLADVPRRPPRRGWRPAGARFEPRALPGGDPAAFVAANLSGAPARYEARVTLHAPAEEVAARAPSPAGDRRARSTTRTCELRTQRRLARLAGACGSRCSASTSRSTSRPSWSARCASWRRASSGRRRLGGSRVLSATWLLAHGRWPAGGGRVLSADHALRLRRLRLRACPPPPARGASSPGRAPSPRRGPRASTPFAAAAPAPSWCAAALRRAYRATVVWLRVGEPTGAHVSLAKGGTVPGCTRTLG